VVDAEYFDRLNPAEIIILITSDYYKEEYEKLQNINVINSYVDVVYYFANKETEYENEYRERYKTSPLGNIIIFRSGPHAASYVKGMDFADNARALFEYLLENGYNKKYELVWLVKDPSEFERYHGIPNVKFLSFDWSISAKKEERDSYYRALCLAKYIFFTDAYGFARNCRNDQIRIQLWHGCGFKTRVNFVRCEKRYEYTTVISELYSKIHQEIYGLREDQMLVTGYAKQDWLFQPIDEWQEKLDVPKAEKYIFWLPTFRSAKEQLQNLDEYELGGQTGLPVVNTYGELEELNDLLKSVGIILLIKLHPFQDKEKIGRIDLTNIVMLDNERLVEADMPVNRLLGHADALISDYSSAAVDYMLLDRPIAFTLDDVEEYEQSRGFVFENIRDQLPGKELYSFDNMCTFVREIGEGVDSTQKKRRELTTEMHKYQDDNNCKRIVEVLQISL
ncbi:MAG: CDP-glycerol glycerophosphotransferase family protein, partial [Lachnospiraceae bacterium]|nr:CDP-glycerol glycerophosphotransferase family protein [Lachnospiraceae bacterium]